MRVENTSQADAWDERLPKITSCLVELAAQNQRPPTGDRYYGEFAGGTLEACAEDATSLAMLEEALESTNVSPSYAVKKILSFVQYQYVDVVDDYPVKTHQSEADWKRDFLSIAHDPTRRSAFIEDFRLHELQSNVAEREKSLAPIIKWFHTYYNRAPTVLDVGCSLGLGLKQLAVTRQFRPVTVDMPGYSEASRQMFSERFNEALVFDVDSILPFALGVDRQSPTEESVRRARSDSLYPGERAQHEMREQLDFLLAANPPNVAFGTADLAVSADLSNLHNPDDLNRMPARGFDIVLISTVMYQNSLEDQLRILENTDANVSEEGFAVVQEFGYRDTAARAGFRIREKWFDDPYPYRAMVYDKTNPDAGFQTFCAWTNARVTKMKPGRIALEMLTPGLRRDMALL